MAQIYQLNAPGYGAFGKKSLAEQCATAKGNAAKWKARIGKWLYPGAEAKYKKFKAKARELCRQAREAGEDVAAYEAELTAMEGLPGDELPPESQQTALQIYGPWGIFGGGALILAITVFLRWFRRRKK